MYTRLSGICSVSVRTCRVPSISCFFASLVSPDGPVIVTTGMDLLLRSDLVRRNAYHQRLMALFHTLVTFRTATGAALRYLRPAGLGRVFAPPSSSENGAHLMSRTPAGADSHRPARIILGRSGQEAGGEPEFPDQAGVQEAHGANDVPSGNPKHLDAMRGEGPAVVFAGRR